MRGAGVQHAVDLQRGVLVGQLHRVVVGRQVAGTDAPGFFQAVGVLRGDLAQWRVAVAMLGAAVGLPFAVGHGGRGTGHLAALAADFAEHFTGVGELATQGTGARGQHCNAEQRGVGLGCRANQRATRPWQQQNHADGEPDGQARYQLPPVKAHFQQCPGRAAEQHQAIQPKGDAALGQQQDAGQGKADACDQVVQRSAQLAQLDTASQQGQAHQQQQHAQKAR
ncbi:hypothetical protein D3C76_1025160 [compost metagenome]